MMTILNKIEFIAACRRIAVVAMLAAVPTTSAFAQNLVASVNGDPITALDVEQRIKFTALSTHKTPSREEVINELIDEKLKIREGKRWGVEATDDEVDQSYASMASRNGGNAARLTEQLAHSGITPGTLKQRIRSEIVWQQLVRGRYSSRLQLSDKDIELALASSKTPEEAEATATDYILRPILLLVTPGSGSAAYDTRKKEAEALRGRFKDCQEGISMARTMVNAVVREQVIRSSSDLPAELRKILDAVPIGQLTPPDITKHGVELFAVCGKQASKADTPSKRKAREAMFNARFEQQSKTYLQQLRRDAMIERK